MGLFKRRTKFEYPQLTPEIKTIVRRILTCLKTDLKALSEETQKVPGLTNYLQSFLGSQMPNLATLRIDAMLANCAKDPVLGPLFSKDSADDQ